MKVYVVEYFARKEQETGTLGVFTSRERAWRHALEDMASNDELPLDGREYYSLVTNAGIEYHIQEWELSR